MRHKFSHEHNIEYIESKIRVLYPSLVHKNYSVTVRSLIMVIRIFKIVTIYYYFSVISFQYERIVCELKT